MFLLPRLLLREKNQSKHDLERAGPKYFKVWWDKACEKLGVMNLDLYGGTRHTSTTEIARIAGTQNAREASAHETNKAFDRYCQFQNDTAFKMAELLKDKGKGEVIEFPKKQEKI